MNFFLKIHNIIVDLQRKIMDDYVPHIDREKQRKRGHMNFWINILIFVLVPILIFLCFAEDTWYKNRKKRYR